MTEADSLEVAGWRMAAGSLPFEQLPGIAIEALESGFNSPSLCLLAGQPWFFFDESVALFRAALEELGIELLDADSARWRLVRRTAEDMVAGRIKAAAGAAELCAAEREVRDSAELLIFVGLESELDDHPEDAQQIEEEMVAAARELLARTAP